MTEQRNVWVHANRAFAEVLNKPVAYWYGGGDGTDRAAVRDVSCVVRSDGEVMAVMAVIVEAQLPGLEDARGAVSQDTHEYRVSSYVMGSRHMEESLDDTEVGDEVTSHYTASMPSWYSRPLSK